MAIDPFKISSSFPVVSSFVGSTGYSFSIKISLHVKVFIKKDHLKFQVAPGGIAEWSLLQWILCHTPKKGSSLLIAFCPRQLFIFTSVTDSSFYIEYCVWARHLLCNYSISEKLLKTLFFPSDPCCCWHQIEASRFPVITKFKKWCFNTPSKRQVKQG